MEPRRPRGRGGQVPKLDRRAEVAEPEAPAPVLKKPDDGLVVSFETRCRDTDASGIRRRHRRYRIAVVRPLDRRGRQILVPSEW